MTIKEFLHPLLGSGVSKYSIAKKLDVQPIMIDHYLKNDGVLPAFRVCKAVYDNFKSVIYPYNEQELNDKHEQTIMVFDTSLKSKLEGVRDRLDADNTYDREILESVIKEIK